MNRCFHHGGRLTTSLSQTLIMVWNISYVSPRTLLTPGWISGSNNIPPEVILFFLLLFCFILCGEKAHSDPGTVQHPHPPPPPPHKFLFSFFSSTALIFSFLLFDSCGPDSPRLLPPFVSLIPSQFLPPPLAAPLLCNSQQSSWRWLGEPGSLVLDGRGTRQGLWSLGSPVDWRTKPWWKKVSSKKFTLRPVVKENGDVVTAAGFFPLSSLSKTCPLQRDGMRFSTIWECSVTQYYLRFPPCFMLLSDPWVLPSSQRSMTLRWLANSPIILTVNGRTIDCVILYFASLSLSVLSPLIPRYQTQKPK